MLYSPKNYHDNIPQFDLKDVVDYGLPEVYGYTGPYNVIDNPEVSQPFVLDYQMECDLRGNLRPIHRYSAVKRFESTLRQLFGTCRNPIPRAICFLFKDIKADPDNIWNISRSILKTNGYIKYYNRIPEILQVVGYTRMSNPNYLTTELIINDFRKILNNFHCGEYGRTYMPSYRFIAFKLLARKGIVFDYHIPLLRVKKKLLEMNIMWEELVKCLD